MGDRVQNFHRQIERGHVRSEPEKAISCLSDGGNAAGTPSRAVQLGDTAGEGFGHEWLEG